MNDTEVRIAAGVDRISRKIEQITAMYKPEWDARRDTSKTLISLSGATLVFTITFSQSAFKQDTPNLWRYAVVACWLAFIVALVCSLASLWFSMTLNSLPIIFTQKEGELKSALEESFRVGNSEPFVKATMNAFRVTVLQEKIALWFLRFGIIFYGLALSLFTAVGLRQLLH